MFTKRLKTGGFEVASNGFEVFEGELFGAGIRRNAGFFEELRNGSFRDTQVF